MHQPARDLFGQVPITHQDIDQWLISVPHLSPQSPRAAWYIRAYDVVGKITAAKLAGTFEACTTPREHPTHWWHRFNWW